MKAVEDVVLPVTGLRMMEWEIMWVSKTQYFVLALVAYGSHATAQTTPTASELCKATKPVSLDSIWGKTLAPGPHVILVKRRSLIDLEMAGGGGGGGGSSDVHMNPAGPGDGGKAGAYFFKRIVMMRGRYLLTVGAGGTRGTSAHPDNPGTPGGNGEPTTFGSCPLGLPVVPAIAGGEGGEPNHFANADNARGGNGEDLTSSATTMRVGHGGAGGAWMANGQDATGYGAGGGGSGGTRTPDRIAGKGASGFARLARVRRRV